MRQVSEAYALITNLANAAKHHAAHCEESDCNVSLTSLLFAARKLAEDVWSDEREEVDRMLQFENWPH